MVNKVMIEIDFPYYFFGSKDSLDIDVMINHPQASGIERDKELINDIKQKYPSTTDWNINIITIDNGVVTNTIPSKGNPDGVNNSLYETYNLHKQKYPFPLLNKVERDCNTAIEKCLSYIFTFYKNTECKNLYKYIPKEIKNGKAEISIRLEHLKNIDLTHLPYLEDIKNKNAFKSLAFNIGQTISLINGIEIYTKSDLVYYHINLSSFIKRESIGDLKIINQKKEELIQKIKEFYGLD
ncbi:hypothetical protein [Flavobacterium suzhouense]|uniref:Nucleotidyltransferase n=1 Tax=Flavobacterium suzhouense TaxID=1529638 RepID=A0ABW5NWQ1_9FLAO